MKTKTFYIIEEIKPYYIEETNTYDFTDFDLVEFEFDLNVKSDIKAININALNINSCDINALNINASNINALNINASNINAWNIDASNINALNINALNIKAFDINACNIKALNIKAFNINALNITANNISYYAFCIAYKNIKCSSIKGRRENSFHKALDGKVEVKQNEK